MGVRCRRDSEIRNEEYLELISQVKNYAVSILTNLADGYNKYHAEDKVALYTNARSSVSCTQALLLILGELNVLSKELSKKLVAKFDEKMKMFNGLIRKLEGMT